MSRSVCVVGEWSVFWAEGMSMGQSCSIEQGAYVDALVRNKTEALE